MMLYILLQRDAFLNNNISYTYVIILSYIFEGFRMLTQEEEIPDGWRLASLHDTSKYEEEAREAITEEWGICTLVDGKICGPGYKFEIETGSFFDLGHKLATNKGSGM